LLNDRLKNQKLIGSTLRQPQEIVRWLGAVQAQDFAGAKWALALRAPDLSDAVIEKAFTDGKLLRTHVLRPTWHFVTPPDIRWMLALNASRLQRISFTYGKRLGLTTAILTKARKVVESALEGGHTLTRAELSARLARARIQATGQRLAHLLFDLEQQAVICSGPRRGKQFTYALFSERVTSMRPISREEALTELATRYFQSHGPATVRDFAWWSGLTMGDARLAIKLSAVSPLETPPALQRAAKATFLLPNYDEYLVAYRDRGAVIDPMRARNLGVFTSLEFPHQLVVDGRVAGSWRRGLTDKALTIDIWPYARLSKPSMTAIDVQAARLAAFLNVPYSIRMR
jgi:hypothetical protein